LPYIKPAEREPLDLHLAALAENIDTPGQLNYAITYLCLAFLPEARSYATFNTVIGVLACAQHEMYRAQVGPYERGAMSANGAVIGPTLYADAPEAQDHRACGRNDRTRPLPNDHNAVRAAIDPGGSGYVESIRYERA
jgi:hypothetical protein